MKRFGSLHCRWHPGHHLWLEWNSTDADRGGDGGAQGLAIQSDGKIVVGGTIAVSKDETFIVLARYTSDGILDTSFDSDGLVIGPDGYFASDIALQADGKIVLGRYTPNDMFLMRYE